MGQGQFVAGERNVILVEQVEIERAAVTVEVSRTAGITYAPALTFAGTGVASAARRGLPHKIAANSKEFEAIFLHVGQF